METIPKYSPVLRWPTKIPLKYLHTPKNIFFFLKIPKNEIQNFEPKNGAGLRIYENIRVPPPLGYLSGCWDAHFVVHMLQNQGF